MPFSRRNKVQGMIIVTSWFIAAQMSTASASEHDLSRETKAHAASAARVHCNDNSTYHREPDPALTASIKSMSESNDQSERLVALAQLSEQRTVDPEVAAEILHIALLDDDPLIRGQAVYAIGRRGGMDASIVLDQALTDQIPSVRLMAVDALVAGDEENTALLRKALEDEDAAVRELASSKLGLLAK